ncbi:MAG: hypothetical protein ACREKI_03745 [Gemmatimonadota bacterium]
MSADLRKDLELLIHSRYPIIAVETPRHASALRHPEGGGRRATRVGSKSHGAGQLVPSGIGTRRARGRNVASRGRRR